MTWGELKALAEKDGVTDDTEILMDFGIFANSENISSFYDEDVWTVI